MVNRERGCGAHVAQLVEHFLGKGEVTGSIPVAGSKKRKHVLVGFRQGSKHYGKKQTDDTISLHRVQRKKLLAGCG